MNSKDIIIVPQKHLKGLTIVFTGQFRPYNKDRLRKLCEKLGAKCPNYISGLTSVLIQGSEISENFGRINRDRDINSTKKTRQAISKGVPVVQNHEMDQYFIEKTGKSFQELINLTQKPSDQYIVHFAQAQRHSMVNKQTNLSKMPQNVEKLEQSFINLIEKPSNQFTVHFAQTQRQPIAKKQTNSNHIPQNVQKLEQNILDKPSQEINIVDNYTFTKRSNKSNIQIIERQKSQKDNIVKLKQSSNKSIITYYDNYHDMLKRLKQIKKGVCFQKNMTHKIEQIEQFAEKCLQVFRNLTKSITQFDLDQQRSENQYNQALVNKIKLQNSIDVPIGKISEKESLRQSSLKLWNYEKLSYPNTSQVYSDCSKIVNSSNILLKPSQPQALSKKQQLCQKKQAKQTQKSLRQNLNNLNHQYNINFLPLSDYLSETFISEQTVSKRYKEINQKTRNFYASIDGGNIELGQNSFELNHCRFTLNVQNLVKFDLQRVQLLNLNQCQVNNQGWKTLSLFAFNLKNLKILSLTSNKIQSIDQSDLESFLHLRIINFGQQKYNCNPLNPASIEALRRFSSENWNRKQVVCYKLTLQADELSNSYK